MKLSFSALTRLLDILTELRMWILKRIEAATFQTLRLQHVPPGLTSKKVLLFTYAVNLNLFLMSLILYELCIILQYVYKPTRCSKFLWFDFIFQYTLYMFRTVSVHLQEQTFYKLYVVFGICRYHTVVVVAIATQQPHVSAYTKYDIQLIKSLLLKMDWYSPKHVERILKNKVEYQEFWAFCWFIYILFLMNFTIYCNFVPAQLTNWHL